MLLCWPCVSNWLPLDRNTIVLITNKGFVQKCIFPYIPQASTRQALKFTTVTPISRHSNKPCSKERGENTKGIAKTPFTQQASKKSECSVDITELTYNQYCSQYTQWHTHLTHFYHVFNTCVHYSATLLCKCFIWCCSLFYSLQSIATFYTVFPMLPFMFLLLLLSFVWSSIRTTGLPQPCFLLSKILIKMVTS